jgi:ABC-type lipoprotein export system ATPase subunit
MNSKNGNRLEIIELLTETKNATVVVVSNDEEFANRCDRVITMVDGSIVTSGRS